MKGYQWRRVALCCTTLVLCNGMAAAQSTGAASQAEEWLNNLKAERAGQPVRRDRLTRTLGQLKSQRTDWREPASHQILDRLRGTGAAASGVADTPGAAAERTAPVGQPPADAERAPEVAPIFEQPGVLTPPGQYIIEPSLQFGYSSSNRVVLVGYTIIPAVLVGLVDVREVKRNTWTAALTARTGLNNRFEVEARLPYVRRSDSVVSREIFTGTSVENVFDTDGHGVGDVEFAARYQFNDGGADKAYFIGGLRFKTRTGKDPFEVVTDCNQRCVGTTSGTGLPLELPTGSGFYSIQPNLTWLLPSDPAVFFGSFSYLHSFSRENISRRVLAGAEEFVGTVAPGDIFGFNIGMGLALNEKSAFSIGYDHSVVGRTRQNGNPVPGSVRTHLATVLFGHTYRFNERRSVSVSVGAGLTRDTPDVTLTIRYPMTF